MAGRLILCSSPIGNLDDASPRLRRALAESDVVFAEDTRRSRVLLEALGTRRPMRSYFAGNEEYRSEELKERLAAGDTVALLTDAGVPGIADPGYSAVRAALEVGAAVTAVPGPSAVTTALAVSGLPSHRFLFEGFLPKSGAARRSRLDSLAHQDETIVLFVAKGRLGRDLADLTDALGGDRPVAIARELTKAFEEVWRGTLAKASARWGRRVERGEFTVVVGGAGPLPADLDDAVARIVGHVAEGMPHSEAVRRVARETGLSRRTLYEASLPSGGE